MEGRTGRILTDSVGRFLGYGCVWFAHQCSIAMLELVCSSSASIQRQVVFEQSLIKCHESDMGVCLAKAVWRDLPAEY